MSETVLIELDIPDATVCLLQYNKANAFERLKEETPWEQRTIHVYGREVKQPRLTAFYGEPDAKYAYSGIAHDPLPWTDLISEMRQDIENLLEHHFNSVLLNYYRSGDDSIGFHADDEPELDHVIASLSLGSARTLIFRHKEGKYPDVKVEQSDGTLMLMMGQTQENWLHGINKKKVAGERINMTFRTIR